ncbi:hypothetical protein MJH54_34120, partial [Salmonella enterica subsp. enterica serovar Montevideo]|nr:hypothetical protein [Salmonella enterica subsp. enterica serovar Montevideo]
MKPGFDVISTLSWPVSFELCDAAVNIGADLQWGLKHDPYCCADNMDRKEIDDVIFEINNFMSLGGRTIV